MRRLALPLVASSVLALVVGALLTPSSARATLAEALDLATLVERSDDIVVARALSSSARWRGRRIVTDVVLEAHMVEKGNVAEGSRFEVTLLGGSVDDIGMRIAGEAALEPGKDYVLFLRRVSGLRRPVGMSQGALLVTTVDGEQVVHPGGGGLALVRRSSTGTMVQAPGAVPEDRPLVDLLEAIRELR